MGKEGDENTMMTVGLGVVGSLYSFGSDFALQRHSPGSETQQTLIARGRG